MLLLLRLHVCLLQRRRLRVGLAMLCQLLLALL
jgi:hypothetical protein